jgi:hypothetical protein
MNKKYKGEFGYIPYRKKLTITRTVVMLAITVAIFLVGLLIFKSQKSIFSIIAAVCCLPTGLSAVNMIIFLRAFGCSDSDHEQIEAHRGNLLIHYDHVITSYDKNFNVAATTVLDKNICCYTSDKSYDTPDLEKHIRKMMASSGYTDYSIKVFDKLPQFLERLDSLEKLRAEKNIDPVAIEDAWVAGTQETPASVLLSISL